MHYLMRLAIIVIAAYVAPAAVAQTQQTLPIAAFYGHYAGGGVAEDPDSLFFEATARDFDVAIGPAGNGFHINWTTILRKGGDPENPKIVKRSSELTFVPTDKPDVFMAEPNGNAALGEPVSWARLSGHTLTTYTFEIDENGIYHLSSYARSLDGGGMILEFKSLRDGHPVRVVTGRLVKQSN